MDETDYKELLEYLIEQLEKKQAYNIVDQIKEVAASKVTEDDLINNNLKKSQKTLESIPELSKEIIDANNSKSSDFNDKLKYNNIGTAKLRNLTNEEIFSRAVEILINYLQTMPKMANRISTLFNTNIENIKWGFEENENFYKKRIDPLSSLLVTDTIDGTKINENLNILKAVVITGEGSNSNKSST